MILTVTPNPCVDKTVFIDQLTVGAFMRSQRYTCIPGGKGTNVSRAVQALGRATKALVVVGGHSGAHVVEMIRQQDGVECLPVWVAAPTRTITTVLEETIHRQTAFFEPGPQVSEQEAESVATAFEAALAGVQVATFNGTVPDPRLNALYRRLILLAKQAGVCTILDSHGPALAEGLEAAPYMVKPNIAETEELVGFPLDSDAARWKAIERLHQKGVTLVVLSLGKDGALVSCAGERFHARPPEIHEVNPVGSGDALVAGFAIGLAEQLPLKDMAILGVAAGTANAMSWDIAHFSQADVNVATKQVRIEPVA